MVVLVPLALIFLPRYRKSARLIDEGIQLLSQGRIFAALEHFEAARPLARSRVIPTHNIGISRLCLWQLEEAERELASVAERDDLLPEFRRLLFSWFALVAALDGRLKEAVQRLDESRGPQGELLLGAVLASAVIDCRRGAWAEARGLLEGPEPQGLPGPLRGLREALRAWCQAQLTGEQRPVDLVTLFGEASHDKLQAAWPELVSFLLERARSGQLSSKALRSPPAAGAAARGP